MCGSTNYFTGAHSTYVMPNLFVDIETVPNMTHDEYFQTKKDIDSGLLTKDSEDKDRFWGFTKGGLVPYWGRVVLITYKVNNGYTHRLKEWEGGEKVILKKFLELIIDLQRGNGKDKLRIIGHNILGFDLFFLYVRMKSCGISEDKWLYQYIINKPEVIDLLQIHLPVNGFKTKGLKHDVLAHAYGFPIKESLGSEEILHYFQREYDKIIQYSEREFIYPELYKRIESGGLVSSSRLKESISWYHDRLAADTAK